MYSEQQDTENSPTVVNCNATSVIKNNNAASRLCSAFWKQKIHFCTQRKMLSSLLCTTLALYIHTYLHRFKFKKSVDWLQGPSTPGTHTYIGTQIRDYIMLRLLKNLWFLFAPFHLKNSPTWHLCLHFVKLRGWDKAARFKSTIFTLKHVQIAD
jgi:hypothetical protein